MHLHQHMHMLHYITLTLHCFTLHYITYIHILWNQHLGTKCKKTCMRDATCRSSTHSLQKEKRIYHGPKIEAINLEAVIWWPRFWVQNLASVLGPQNTNRSCSTRAAGVLLLTQADSSTYPWYSAGTCPRSLLYYLFKAPVLGPWAHLGFETKRPQFIKGPQGMRYESQWLGRETTKHIEKNY